MNLDQLWCVRVYFESLWWRHLQFNVPSYVMLCMWDNNATGNRHGASYSPHVTSVWPAFVYLMLSESAHHLASPSGPKYYKQAALAVSVSLVRWVQVPWWAGRAVICFVVPSSWSWHLLPPRCATQRCSSSPPFHLPTLPFLSAVICK